MLKSEINSISFGEENKWEEHLFNCVSLTDLAGHIKVFGYKISYDIKLL